MVRDDLSGEKVEHGGGSRAFCMERKAALGERAGSEMDRGQGEGEGGSINLKNFVKESQDLPALVAAVLDLAAVHRGVEKCRNPCLALSDGLVGGRSPSLWGKGDLGKGWMDRAHVGV